MKYSFLFLLIFLSTTPLRAQNFTPSFIAEYNNDSTATYFSMVASCADSAGNFYVMGINSNYEDGLFLRKYDENGNELFRKSYYNPNSYIYPVTILADDSANIYIGALLQADHFYAEIFKFDSSGNILWIDTILNPSVSNEFFKAWYFDSEHNLYVTGNCETDTSGGTGLMIGKVSSGGENVWVEVISGTTTPSFIKASGNKLSVIASDMYSIINTTLDTSGVLLNSDTTSLIELQGHVISTTDLNGTIFTALRDDVTISKFFAWDIDGNKIADNLLPDFQPESIITRDSSLYISGGILNNSSTIFHGKFALNGDSIWTKQFGDFNTFSRTIRSLFYMHDQIFISATIAAPNENYVINCRLDTSGNILNTDTFSVTNKSVSATDFTINNNSQILFTGEISLLIQRKDAYIGYDTLLNRKFYKWEDVFSNGKDVSQFMHFDTNDNLILVGTSTDSTGSPAIEVLKYKTDGTLLWDKIIGRYLSNYLSIYDAKIGINNSILISGNNFFIKLDSLGNILYLKDLRSSNDTSALEALTDPYGNTYIVYSKQTDCFIEVLNDQNQVVRIFTVSPGGVPMFNRSLIYKNNSLYLLAYNYGPSIQQFIVKCDTLGNILWQQAPLTFPHAQQSVSGQLSMSSLEKIIYYGNSSGSSLYYNYAAQLDTNGTLEWDYRGHPSIYYWGRFSDIDFGTTGELYLTGEVVNSLMQTNIIITKLDSTGNEAWSDSIIHDSVNPSIIFRNNLVYVCGKVYNGNLPYAVFNVHDGNGNLVYQYDFPLDSSTSSLTDICVDTVGNCYYTFTSDVGLGNTNIELYKFTYSPNSVIEIPVVDIKAYPNPSSNQIFIPVSNQIDKNNILIFDEAGKSINSLSQISKFQNGIVIDISKFKSGVYTFRISAGEIFLIGRFVKIE